MTGCVTGRDGVRDEVQTGDQRNRLKELWKGQPRQNTLAFPSTSARKSSLPSLYFHLQSGNTWLPVRTQLSNVTVHPPSIPGFQLEHNSQTSLYIHPQYLASGQDTTLKRHYTSTLNTWLPVRKQLPNVIISILNTCSQT